MRSFTQLKNLFTTLSQNTATANDTLAGILINQEHRYLLQKYFDNERSLTMLTIGAQQLAITTSTLAAGSTTATLTSAWPSTNITCQQLVVFGDSEQRNVTFTQGSTTITWLSPTTTVQSSATIATVGVQSYPLPANVSKLKNPTINVGQLVYTPAPIQSIQEWTKLNALPYTSNIPAYFYIYNNQLNFWPIPSSSGEVVTIYPQVAIGDMTYADYTTGTIATLTVGSNAVTGSATTWAGTYPTNTDLTFVNLNLTVTPPGGDGLLYPIQSFTDNTHLILFKPIVNSPNAVGASYTIGQYPLLSPDFHDDLVYRALKIYYNSIVKDPDKFKMYDAISKEKEEFMKAYLSNKSVNVDLSVTPALTNPNLFPIGS